ncbi:MAG TPA: hypothetical protein VGE27_17810 [Gemmatimonas sp.]|uniref:hypothetical protein n=1 Tax=Gemmatimonas sp. TaxID=1962908 RepID=UPI002ED96C08
MKVDPGLWAAWLVATHNELLHLYRRVASLHASLSDFALDSAARGHNTERLWRASEAARMLSEDAWTIMQKPTPTLFDLSQRAGDEDERR